MSAFAFHAAVRWQAGEQEHPARLASWRAMNALADKDKDAYLSLYAPSGGLEDPVGPSTYDPAGEGHYGREKLAAFWDSVIGTIESFHFVITDSFAAGDEVVNVGKVTTSLPDGRKMDTEGVFQYRVDAEGLLLFVRTFWELERALATVR